MFYLYMLLTVSLIMFVVTKYSSNQGLRIIKSHLEFEYGKKLRRVSFLDVFVHLYDLYISYSLALLAALIYSAVFKVPLDESQIKTCFIISCVYSILIAGLFNYATYKYKNIIRGTLLYALIIFVVTMVITFVSINLYLN